MNHGCGAYHPCDTLKVGTLHNLMVGEISRMSISTSDNLAECLTRFICFIFTVPTDCFNLLSERNCIAFSLTFEFLRGVSADISSVAVNVG